MSSSRVRRTAGEWTRLVRAWKRSGLTAARFAASRGFSAQTLTWWRWRLSHAKTRVEERPAVRLLPVEVVESDAGAGPQPAWELVAASGHTLRVYDGADAEALRIVVDALTRGRSTE
jgi:transposase